MTADTQPDIAAIRERISEAGRPFALTGLLWFSEPAISSAMGEPLAVRYEVCLPSVKRAEAPALLKRLHVELSRDRDMSVSYRRSSMQYQHHPATGGHFHPATLVVIVPLRGIVDGGSE